jgi:hypothetical protein
MPSLTDAILEENLSAIDYFLANGADVNEIDIYGFTPLIEAAIVNNQQICQRLLVAGADVNGQDTVGGSALHWACENNNTALCQLLLKHHANPNLYNFAGQPPLVLPTLRQQSSLRQLLIKQGADEIFCQDFLNTKLLGHLFELVGTASIISPQQEYVEVNFEGYYLEVTINLIRHELANFLNHYAARELRRFAMIGNFIVNVLQHANQLCQFQQYRIDIKKHQSQISQLLAFEPLIIPVGYEGHAITFIKYQDIWIKCDRREDSRLYDNIVLYQVTNTRQLTEQFIQFLLYQKHSSEFINDELQRLLGLKPLTEIKVEAQISGNCTWANVEATIPALFYLIISNGNQDLESMPYYKTLSLNYFNRWREWCKDRQLNFCIQSYHKADVIRRACKAEVLACILFQHSHDRSANNEKRLQAIYQLLNDSPYRYLLQNYLRIYYYESTSEEGKHFATLLREYDFKDLR